MLSLMSVPPRSLAPQVRRCWASFGPSFTHEAWMLRKLGPRISRARACIFTTSAPVPPGRTPGTRPRRYMGASEWIRERGTNSVKPPVSRWMERSKSMCRTQWRGVSMWPYMIVEVHPGQRLLDGPAEVDVVAAVELGREPRLDADLRGAQVPRLLGAADHLRERQEVALLLPVVAAEGAEGAVLDADVREVDVAVHDVGGGVAYLPPPQLVGREAERVELAALDLGEAISLRHGQFGAVERARQDPAYLRLHPVEGCGQPVHRGSTQCLQRSYSILTYPPPSTSASTRGRSPSARNSGREAY